MEEPIVKLKKCYLHPDKVAIAGCFRCGMPICSPCVKGSRTPGMCPPCSSADFVAGEKSYPEGVAQKEVFEITVRADNEAEAQESTPAPGFGQGAFRPLDEKSSEAEAREEDVLTPEGESIPETFIEIQSIEKKEEPPGVESQTAPEPIPGFAVDVPKQLLMGFVGGLAGGVITYALWLFLAAVRNNWSQLAVFNAGIMIPWFLFKGTTAKKHLGIPVYRRSPPAIWMAVISILIMLALLPVAEYIAYKTAYSASSEGNTLRGFISQKFKGADIAIIVVGFLLSFGVPFFLKLGERPIGE